MKELSIEEKAKVYDEALAKAAKIHRNYKGRVRAVDVVIEEVFPELQESEDERIREEIISALKFANVKGVYDKHIAWLEKAGNNINCIYDKELSELLHIVIRKFINDPYISYSDREKVSMKVLPYVEMLEKQGEGIDYANKEYWRGYREGKQEILDKYAKLEKQGEHKPTIEMKTPEESLGIDSDTYNKIVDECIYGEQKPAEEYNITGISSKHAEGKLGEMLKNRDNNVEPKFKVGDWIVYNRDDCSKEIIQVYDIRDDRYYFTDNVHFSWSVKECDEKCHLWTIKDAKPGDVLCCENGWTCIFKVLNSDISFSSYCFMDNTGWFCETGSESHTLDKAFIKAYYGKIYPATEEQRNLLFQKIHEAGYKWDAEKKELKKIEPVEWSEDDENILTAIIYTVKNSGYKHCIGVSDETMIEWLKSLKERAQPQSQWKPSESTILLLESMANGKANPQDFQASLGGLIGQLKKLREE